MPPSEGRAARAAPSARVKMCLVGEHHRLDPVAQVELPENVGHVRLHRALAEEESAGYLGVVQALCDTDKDLALTRSQGLQPWVLDGDA